MHSWVGQVTAECFDCFLTSYREKKINEDLSVVKIISCCPIFGTSGVKAKTHSDDMRGCFVFVANKLILSSIIKALNSVLAVA